MSSAPEYDHRVALEGQGSFQGQISWQVGSPLLQQYLSGLYDQHVTDVGYKLCLDTPAKLVWALAALCHNDLDQVSTEITSQEAVELAKPFHSFLGYGLLQQLASKLSLWSAQHQPVGKLMYNWSSVMMTWPVFAKRPWKLTSASMRSLGKLKSKKMAMLQFQLSCLCPFDW
jgi:hypothetical protein